MNDFDQVAVLNEIIKNQRSLLEEYKRIISDKDQVLDDWYSKYRNLAIEAGHLRGLLNNKSED